MSSKRLLDLMENISDDLILEASEEHDYSAEQAEQILETDSSAKREKTIKKQRTLTTILATALPAACIIFILSIGITRYVNYSKTAAADVQGHNASTESISEEISTALGGDKEKYKIVDKSDDLQKIKPDPKTYKLNPDYDTSKFVNHDPNETIAVFTDQADSSGCTVIFVVKDENYLDKFYTYGECSLYKYNDQSYDLIPSNSLIEEVDEVHFDKSSTEVHYDLEKYFGKLEKGYYYITITIYDKDNSGSKIDLSTSFTIQ